jgi:uncharacterized spore protein YtfJ
MTMEVPEILQNLQGLAQQIAVKTIYGEPIVAGNTTVIPVACVAFGMGGGFGRNKKAENGQGGGGGGGFRGWPAGYIEITPAGTRFVSVHDYRKLALGLLAGIAIGVLVGKMRKRR